jgi:hypothetical protein
MFPPGFDFDKLSTSPTPTGSTNCAATTGINCVACFSVAAPSVEFETMTSGLSATSSAAPLRIALASPCRQRSTISMLKGDREVELTMIAAGSASEL